MLNPVDLSKQGAKPGTQAAQGNWGVVFPGQGSQRRGMALDFLEAFAESRQVFETAGRVLPFNVRAICSDDDRRLDMTEFTQPCILAAEIAMFRGLEAGFGFAPRYFGGHSLGEYTALVAAGAIPLPVALRLVHLRGQLMQQAVPLGVGAMAAVIMEALPREAIAALAAERGIDIANDNSPNQVVLSGEKAAVEELSVILPGRYASAGLRVVPLTVSAPFHSRSMRPVEDRFREALIEVQHELDAQKATTVTSNFTGAFHTGKVTDLIEALTSQISGTVRWRDNMALLRQHSGSVVELGPNRPLTGFFKAIGVSVAAIIDIRTARRAFPEAALTAAK